MEKVFAAEYIVLYTCAALIFAGNLYTIYGVCIRNWLVISEYRKLTVAILFTSVVHTIISYIQLAYWDVPIIYLWTNWLLNIFGTGALNLLVICQLELLVLFSPIAPFWTRKLVSQLKWFSVILNLSLNFPAYCAPLLVANISPSAWRMIFSQVLKVNSSGTRWGQPSLQELYPLFLFLKFNISYIKYTSTKQSARTLCSSESEL
jgi:hypothetical protein